MENNTIIRVTAPINTDAYGNGILVIVDPGAGFENLLRYNVIHDCMKWGILVKNGDMQGQTGHTTIDGNSIYQNEAGDIGLNPSD